MKTQNFIPKLVFSIILTIIAGAANAQDIIKKCNGEEIRAIVQEVGNYEVTYKLFDRYDSETVILKKNLIFSIQFSNGDKEMFNCQEVSKTKQPETPKEEQTPTLDLIILTSGEEVEGYVKEIGLEDVKYKKAGNPNGPTYMINQASILKIRYANGWEETFATAHKKPVQEYEQPALREDTPVPNAVWLSDKQFNEQTTNKNTETVYLPENMQSRNDVIVRLSSGYGHGGFQAKIMHVDYKHIYYIKFKKNGREVDKRIKQKRVAYTLSFNDLAKQMRYPERMSVQDFMSLPIYFSGNNWTVFGTNGLSNLAHVRKIYPEIYDDYTKGLRLVSTGSTLLSVAMIFAPFGGFFNPLWWAFYIPGAAISGKGHAKLVNSATNYYSNCVNLEISDRYGIIITPYRVNPFTIQVR